MSNDAPLLEMREISKRFDSTQALDAVDLQLYAGEIHALLGENGAGKSTLIKIMTGVYRPDSGSIHLDGEEIQVANPVEAQAFGIAAIHQEPMIFPDLDVAENIFITHRNQGRIVRWQTMYRQAREILGLLDIDLDVRSPASGLTLAAQQAVEIAKAISLQVRVLIMDEPTASLSAHEVEQLFQLVQALKERGVAVLFISHRLEEVFSIADRVTILRDGQRISSRPVSEVDRELAIREMVGRNVDDYFARVEAEAGEVLVEVEDLGREGVFSGINFGIRRGEVLGFAGLVGARRTDVGLALFGIQPADSGSIRFEGHPVEIRKPEEAVNLGIAYVTEDRRQLGLTMPMSITTNITLPMLHEYRKRFGLIDTRAEKARAEHYGERLSIRTPSVDLPVSKLSGGNQQKVMLSKWLNTRPQLLVLDEPTRGIDVGAKAEVHHIIGELAREGLAILLISSDLPEVLAMSDRILVMREGRQMAIFDREEATQERILSAAMGGDPTLVSPVGDDVQ